MTSHGGRRLDHLIGRATILRLALGRTRFAGAVDGSLADAAAGDWSRLARGLTPPSDVQALDDEAYQLMLRAIRITGT